MVRITTRVVEARMEMGTYEAEDKKARTSIGFELIPDDEFDSLELETGEFFSRAYRDTEKTKITMSMSVMRISDEFSAEQQASAIYYSSGVQGDFGIDAYLSVHQYLKSKDYDDLLLNLKNGLIPATISIDSGFHPFEEGEAIGYGPAPDGSQVVWKNKDKENQRVELESIDFSYRLLSQQKDEDGIIDPAVSGPEGHLRKLQLSLKKIEDRLDVTSKYLRWIFYVAVTLAGLGLAIALNS